VTLFTRAFQLFGRLYARFSIEPGAVSAQPPTISTMIVPVTQADVLLFTPSADTATVDIQASAGAFAAFFTVPDGKRWRVKRMMRFGTTGASALMINVGGSAVLLTNTGTSGEAVNLDLLLDQTEAMGLRTTGNAADSAVRADLVYEEEDAF